MASVPKDEKGVALILTITLIGLIVILTLQFSKSVRTGLYEVINLDNSVRLGAIARSGFDCALAVIYEDEAKVDSLQDKWAAVSEYSILSSALFDNGEGFKTEVTDLAGRIQVNRLINRNGSNKGEYNQDQKALMTRLLSQEPFKLETDEIENILGAIKDWIDEDDEVTRLDAENSYYQSFDRPYSCRNSAIEYLDELLLVRGITTVLYYGTKDSPGLKDYLTVYGDDGKININTADTVILRALSDELDDDTMIKELDDWRRDDENNLEKPDWYKEALGTEVDYILPALITTKSSYFQIKSVGEKGSGQKEIIGAIRRSGKKLTILSWKTS